MQDSNNQYFELPEQTINNYINQLEQINLHYYNKTTKIGKIAPLFKNTPFYNKIENIKQLFSENMLSNLSNANLKLSGGAQPKWYYAVIGVEALANFNDSITGAESTHKFPSVPKNQPGAGPEIKAPKTKPVVTVARNEPNDSNFNNYEIMDDMNSVIIFKYNDIANRLNHIKTEIGNLTNSDTNKIITIINSKLKDILSIVVVGDIILKNIIVNIEIENTNEYNTALKFIFQSTNDANKFDKIKNAKYYDDIKFMNYDKSIEDLKELVSQTKKHLEKENLEKEKEKKLQKELDMLMEKLEQEEQANDLNERMYKLGGTPRTKCDKCEWYSLDMFAEPVTYRDLIKNVKTKIPDINNSQSLRDVLDEFLIESKTNQYIKEQRAKKELKVNQVVQELTQIKTKNETQIHNYARIMILIVIFGVIINEVMKSRTLVEKVTMAIGVASASYIGIDTQIISALSIFINMLPIIDRTINVGSNMGYSILVDSLYTAGIINKKITSSSINNMIVKVKNPSNINIVYDEVKQNSNVYGQLIELQEKGLIQGGNSYIQFLVYEYFIAYFKIKKYYLYGNSNVDTNAIMLNKILNIIADIRIPIILSNYKSKTKSKSKSKSKTKSRRTRSRSN